MGIQKVKGYMMKCTANWDEDADDCPGVSRFCFDKAALLWRIKEEGWRKLSGRWACPEHVNSYMDLVQNAY